MEGDLLLTSNFLALPANLSHFLKEFVCGLVSPDFLAFLLGLILASPIFAALTKHWLNFFQSFLSIAAFTNVKNFSLDEREKWDTKSATNSSYSGLARCLISKGLYPPKRSAESVWRERFCTIRLRPVR